MSNSRPYGSMSREELELRFRNKRAEFVSELKLIADELTHRTAPRAVALRWVVLQALRQVDPMPSGRALQAKAREIAKLLADI